MDAFNLSPESTAFSASGEDAITRKIDVAVDRTRDDLPVEDFKGYYDIQRTVEQINQGNYKRIALQFPDELLHDSVPIYRLLKSRIGDEKELYVLADTSYGSCCVDEVAAQHVDADAVVHYGHACMSQTSRLPVIYVFGKKEVDPSDCAAKLLESVKASSSNPLEGRIFRLKCDVTYAHRADSIVDELRRTLPSSTRLLHSPVPLCSVPAVTGGDANEPESHRHEADDQVQHYDSPVEESIILYIGGESLTLTNVLMTHAEVHSYDPRTRIARLESSRTNKLLMRRYALVQKARDADVFGILVGTLGVASYLPVISYLRTILSRAQKKSYTISVGKLNPAKLANFLEIECFVLVACPENSVIDAKEFLRPIITPFELEVALQTRTNWTGRYVLDFDRLLAVQQSYPEASEQSAETEEEDPDQPIFSPVTGTYRHAKRYGAAGRTTDVEDGAGVDSAVVLRNQGNTVATLTDSAAAQYLQNRTFRGLEVNNGQDAPSVLEQGRSGIAKGYQDDHK
ncbi:diphthamide biosynthesis protein [Sparassis latifolia]